MMETTHMVIQRRCGPLPFPVVHAATNVAVTYPNDCANVIDATPRMLGCMR